MTDSQLMIEVVSGFPVHIGYGYDLTNHMWVDTFANGKLRIGMDALGLETSGTLAQLVFHDQGADIKRGAPFGTLEAEKFVGPLVAPVSGRVIATNTSAMTNPGIVQADPYGGGWMIDVEPSDLETEMAMLIKGRDAIVPAFEQKVKQYRLEGVLAE